VLVKPGDEWVPAAANFTTKACEYRAFSFNPFDQISFAKYLKALKPDLVHFWMTPQEPYFYNGARITTTHDLTMLNFTRAGRLPGWLHRVRMIGYRWLLKASLRKAWRIIVPTNFVKDDVVRYLPQVSGKITVTYEASEPKLAIDAVAPNAENLNKYILYVGSAFPHKNLPQLMKAFEILHASHSELKLVLVGKIEQYYTELQTKAQKSAAFKNIVFTGFVGDAQLKWLYENAAAYVFPSLSEGFGLPGLEARVHGCPDASSNATCLPEVYGDAAIYFDPNSATDMAAKIQELLDNAELRASLVNAGYAQAAKYSWRRMAEQTLEVYNSVIK